MSTAHTEGPWYVPLPSQGGPFFVRTKARKVLGSRVGYAICQLFATPIPWAEAEANAYLIATAPELLAASINALAALERMLGPKADQSPAVADLRKAIANAKGNQS